MERNKAGGAAMRPRDKKLFIAALVLAFFYLAEYVATCIPDFGTGSAIFVHMYYTAEAMPFLVSVVPLLPAALALLNIKFRRASVSLAVLCVSVCLAVVHLFFVAYALSKLTFILIAGMPVYIVLAAAAVVVFLIVGFPRLAKRGKKIAAGVLGVLLLFAAVFGVFGIPVFSFTSDGVVFAVEDEYQIAWSTSVPSTGAVTVGGQTFYDESAGENNVSTLHKISVPQALLDGAREYTLHAVPVYSHAAYLSVGGGEQTKTYPFRPVDASDGVQIYNISDNHEFISGAGNAGQYFGDELDLLILNGDNLNDVSSKWQISLIYRLAGRVTKGTRPVLYVRGNHECNGTYAAELSRYVGSRDGEFYYTAELGGVFFLVLDTNNDMEDGNALIAPAANFALVRERQVEWLNGLASYGEGCAYRILLAHMPFALTEYTSFPEWTKQLAAATAGKFDLCISGHSHLLDYTEAGEGTRADYPVLRGSIRSDYRAKGEGISPYQFTGTALECAGGTLRARFTNSKGEVLREISILS